MLFRQRFEAVTHIVEFLNFAQDFNRRHWVRGFLERPKERKLQMADLVQRNLNEEKVINTSTTLYHVGNSGCCSRTDPQRDRRLAPSEK
jgi:hypothetical protein